MTNRLVITLCLGVLACCVPAVVSASVQIQTGDWIVLSTYNDAVRYGNGGEFYVSVYGPGAFNADGSSNYQAALGNFYTFCASHEEVFVPGYAYRVDGLTTASAAFQQSLGARLFAEYWANNNPVAPGNLTGYAPGHNALLANLSFGGLPNYEVAGAIQDEIWNSMGCGYQFGLHSAAEAVFQWSTLGPPNITIDQITLYGPNNNYGYGGPGQPQLYIPPGEGYEGGTVPEPTALVTWSLLGGLGIAILVWRRKKRAAPCV